MLRFFAENSPPRSSLVIGINGFSRAINWGYARFLVEPLTFWGEATPRIDRLITLRGSVDGFGVFFVARIG